MAQVIPRGSARAVVFADRPPLALAEIRAPATPVFRTLAAVFHPELFGVHRLRLGRRTLVREAARLFRRLRVRRRVGLAEREGFGTLERADPRGIALGSLQPPHQAGR